MRSLRPKMRGDVGQLIGLLEENGFKPRVTSGRRTLAQQRKLYNAYLAGGPLAAAPGNSAHNYGLAVDISLDGPKNLRSHYRQMHRAAAYFDLEPLPAEQAEEDPWHIQRVNWRSYVRARRRR